MELRKDPITRSWVICGDEPEAGSSADSFCPFCPESGLPLQVIATSPTVNGSPWSARAVVHPRPLYGIDGEPARSGNGLYDKMQPVGAHEVIVENARHDRHLWNADDREIEEYLALCGKRIQDLKGDMRFKYVSVFKNFGSMSGQEFDHPTSEIVATTFVPRRVLYELRAARQHYQVKERCVFCDILRQEQEQKLRVIEVRGDYMAGCPYAPRVPYETWIAPRNHEAYFERIGAKSGAMRDLPPCCGAPCTAFGPSPTASTWCCTLRPTRCTARRRSASGRPWTTTTIGTWRSCPSSAPRRSPTLSKRCTTRR